MLVDDGSTDDSEAISSEFAASDARFRQYRQPNQGTSAARNNGFRLTGTDSRYITFMDSDDLWIPEALSILRARLEASPDAVGSHGLADFVDVHGAPLEPGKYAATGRRRLGREGWRLVEWPLDRPTDFDVLINGNVLFPPGLILTRRSAYEAAGPFDESLHGPEDWDMLIRLSRYGHFEFIDRVLLHYRRHEKNLGAEPHVAEQAWLVRCKAFHSPENSREQQRAARLGWRAYQVRRASEALTDVRAGWRSRNVTIVFRQLLNVIAFAIRYARGWPSPRVKSTPLRW